MNEYITLEELKATREISGSTFADNDLQLAIAAASRTVDKMCGRRFWLDTAPPAVRYYTARTPNLVTIDDLVTLTSVSVDGAAALVTNTDFMLYPLNAPADGRPYTTLRTVRDTLVPQEESIVGGETLGVAFPTTQRSVAVTGLFGWAAIPDAIKQATGILASRLLMRHREAPFGVVFSGSDIGVATRVSRTDPDVAVLTDPYVRKVPFV